MSSLSMLNSYKFNLPPECNNTVKGHKLNESWGSTLGQLSSPVDSAKDQTPTPLLPLPDRETSSSKPNNNGFPKKRLELENTYTWSSPNSKKQPESVLEHSTTPCAFAWCNKQARQNCLLSPTPPPIPTPSPDATPAPSNSCKRGCSPSPVSGPSKRCQTNNNHSNALPHPYNTCKTAMNKANCHWIKKPKGYQPGCGNHNPIHVAIELQDNYDFSSDIWSLVCKAAIKFCPRNLMLKPGQKLTLKHYGPSTKKKINDYMYKQLPFLYHMRNELGKDSWAINSMLSLYFALNSAYTKAGNDSQDVEDKNNPDTNKAAYQDNYILNACCLKTTQTTLPLNFLPKKQANHNLKKKQPKARADRCYNKDKDNKDKEPDLPPKPTPAQRQWANKVVAQETVCNNTFSNSKGKAGAKPTAASIPGKKGKELGALPEASKSSGHCHKEAKGNSDKDESQDEDNKQPT
ncbi:hypothetical protein RHS03_08248, partial [Rhizoctonia solani]